MRGDSLNHQIFKRILVLSPHTDDGELGTGATIARFIEEGAHVCYIAFSAPGSDLSNECKNALKILNVNDYIILDFPRRHFPERRQEILQFLYEYNMKNEIDLVLTPSQMDLHQDHQTVTNEALRVFKHSTILGYELAWNHIVFKENCFIALDERHVQKKLTALSCYKTQKDKIYFNKDYLKCLIRSRGVQIGEKYAEAYEVIKLVVI